jgi:D-tyrosyl-tRNA(Tyr) deacylase
MRILLQRVATATVSVGDEVVGEVVPGPGLVLLVGVTHDDGAAEADRLAAKVANLRVFDDEQGVMNRSALDRLAAGEPVGVLVVSQFTLYGDVRKGRRPNWSAAAPPAVAASLVERVAAALRTLGLPVETGRFGSVMQVALVNDGPVTLLLDSAEV